MIQIGNRYLRRKYGDRHYSTLRKEEWDELKEY